MKTVIARRNDEAISELCITDLHSSYVWCGDCFPEATSGKAVPCYNGLLKKLALFILVFIFFSYCCYAQTSYTNAVYLPEIKSVEFYNTAKQASFPIIKLGSDEKLLLAFDDLRGGSEDYHYTIEHCDANWNSSNISPAEYLQSYTDDKITNFSYSTTTVQKYTHYELKLPNENIMPKISGNYILKVYINNDQAKLVLTRKMYVVAPKISISAEVMPSADVSLRQTNQKVNFTLNYGSLRVQNPTGEVRTIIMQNARPETEQLNTEPVSIRGPQLTFNDVSTNDFPGGNEFRLFDTRSLKLNSERIQHIYRDTANTVLLLTDPDRSQPNYSFQYDLNGSFYVLNQDGTDPRTDADYAHMIFSLNTRKPPSSGTPYIVGKFNDYQINEHSSLHFDEASGNYLTSLFLKQGVYNYAYVWVDKAGKADDTILEGSHFETENDYQVLVYYRPVGGRWEELVAYRLLNTAVK